MRKKNVRLLSIVTSVALLFSTIPSSFAKASTVSPTRDQIVKAASQHADAPDLQKLKEAAYSEQQNYMKEVSEKIEASKKVYDDNTTGKIQLDGNKDVRLIVELNEKSVKDLSKGMAISKAASDTSLKNSVLSSQAAYKNAVQTINPKAEVKNSYSLLLNGFSITGKVKDVDAIREIPGVKKVSIANEYLPSMNSAKDLTEAVKVWQDMGYKGEGMVVAIVDSGIDYTHKDMKITDASKAKLHDKDAVVSVGPGKFYTDKVPYGYNFADKTDDVIDKNSKTGMHGMHVSGIVAANGDDSEVQANKAIKGVAPEAQLLAMKVFSNNPDFGSAFSDDIIAAIEDSVAHGADVINMSLGSSSGYVQSDSPEQDAVNAANENGVISVISAGNEQYSTAPYKINGMYDTGIVGSPATSKSAFMVASFENNKLTGPAVDYEAGTEKGSLYYTLSEIDPVGVLDNASGYEVVNCGLGQVGEFDGKDVKGKIAVIKRGGNTFIDKKINAQAAGAAGVIIYNKDGDNTYINMATDATVKIPSVFINNADGVKLLNISGAKVKFNGTLLTIPNVIKGDMSDFSSWGPTPNLDLRPYITTPGGNIWSTVNNNNYENMSGTSMAAPHAAGCMALVVQHINKNFSNVTGKDKAELAKELLVNTAQVKLDPVAEETVPFSPRRQGAGLADVSLAVKNNVTAVYNNNGTKEPVVSLHEIVSTASGATKTFDILLHNYGTSDVTYAVKDNYGVLTEQNNDFISSMSYDMKLAGATLTFDNNSITIPAGKDVTVKATLTMTGAALKNVFAEGFVTFESAVDNVPSIGIPYMGFYGNWDTEDNMDAPVWDGYNTIFGKETVLSSQNGDYYYLGFNGLDKYGSPVIDPDKIGISPSDPYAYTNALPMLSYLRNAKENTIEIVDKDGKVVRQIAKDFYMRKSYAKSTYSIDGAWLWDGTEYDSSTGKDEVVPDGQYYIQVRNKVDYATATEKTFQMPVKIDSVAPEVTDISYKDLGSGNYSFKFKASDVNGTGIDNFKFFDGNDIYKANGESTFKLTPDEEGYYNFQMDLGAGNHYVTVVATDFAGNMGIGETAIYKLMITEPNYGEEFNKGDFDVKFEADPSILDSISKFEVFVDPESDKDGSLMTMVGEVEKTKGFFRVTGLEPNTYLILVAGIPSDENAGLTYGDTTTVTVKSQKLGFKVNGIEPGAIYAASAINLSGSFENVPNVFKVNDVDVVVDPNTLTFNTQVALTEGLNKVHFYGELLDKFGKIYDKVDYSINAYSSTALPTLTIKEPNGKVGDNFVAYVDDLATSYTVKGTVQDALLGLGYRLYFNGNQIITVSSEVPTEKPEETLRSFEQTMELTGKETSATVSVTGMNGLGVSDKVIVRKLQYANVGVDFDKLFEGAEFDSTNIAITGHYNFFNKPSLLKVNGVDAVLSETTDTFSVPVTLTKGDSTISVAATSNDGKQTLEQTFNVKCAIPDKTAPVLTINGFEITDSITLDKGTKSYTFTGTANDESGSVSVDIYNNGMYSKTLTSTAQSDISINEEVDLPYSSNCVEFIAYDASHNISYKLCVVIVKDAFSEAGIHFENTLDGSLHPTTDVRFKGYTEMPLEYFKINGKAIEIFKDGSFDKVVTLEEGENDVTIEAKTLVNTPVIPITSGAAITEPSTGEEPVMVNETVKVFCDTTAPVVNISEPANMDLPITVSSATDKLTIKGNISEGFGLKYLTINGENILVDKSTNGFTAEIPLNIGDNEINILAEDYAENRTIKKAIVNRLAINDASLSSVMINGVTLQGFRADKYDYTFVVNGNVSVVPEVSYIIPNSGITKATAQIIPAAAIPGTTQIKVTAEDLSVLTYNINFINAVAIEKLQPTVDELHLGGDAPVIVNATNATDTSKDATLIVALYDANNRFITYAAAHQVIAPKGSTQLLALIDMPSTGTDYKVKCFVWDTIKAMHPLSKVIELQVIK